MGKYYEYKGNHIKNCKKHSTITPGSSTKWNPHPDASVERPKKNKISENNQVIDRWQFINKTKML